jgi:hypothetical protein
MLLDRVLNRGSKPLLGMIMVQRGAPDVGRKRSREPPREGRISSRVTDPAEAEQWPQNWDRRGVSSLCRARPKGGKAALTENCAILTFEILPEGGAP